ncbi:MAG: hypothetical protein ACFBSG_16695 [Leptolyngbyaceae cyanobacterium]
MLNLLQEARSYWRKLDEVEAAYQRGELSIQEVDTRVHQLMADLGQARRRALKDAWASLQVGISAQWETFAGTVAIGVLAVWWLTTVA